MGTSLAVKHIEPSGDKLVLGYVAEAVQQKNILVAGMPAPDFAVMDTNGDTLRLADFRGRHLLLDFWYTSCSPCIRDTPTLVEIYRAQRESGLEIIGVSVDRKQQDVTDYVRKNGMEWLQVLETDNDTKLTEIYNIGGFPSYVWIGPEGRIITPELKGDLDDLLDASL